MNLHAVKTQVGRLKKTGKVAQSGNILRWFDDQAITKKATPKEWSDFVEECSKTQLILAPPEPAYFGFAAFTKSKNLDHIKIKE
jgi:hypothetical protein